MDTKKPVWTGPWRSNDIFFVILKYNRSLKAYATTIYLFDDNEVSLDRVNDNNNDD